MKAEPPTKATDPQSGTRTSTLSKAQSRRSPLALRPLRPLQTDRLRHDRHMPSFLFSSRPASDLLTATCGQ